MRIEDLIKTHEISFVQVATECFVKQTFTKARKMKYYFNTQKEPIESFSDIFSKHLNIVKRLVSSKYFYKGYFVVFSSGSFSEDFFDLYSQEKSLLTRFPEKVYRIEEFSEEKFAHLVEESFYKKYREALLNEVNLLVESMFFVSIKTETSLVVKKLFLKIHYFPHGVF